MPELTLPSYTPSTHVIDICNTTETITTLLAESPRSRPGDIAKALAKSLERKDRDPSRNLAVVHALSVPQEGANLAKAVLCGKFKSRPCDLFLTIYNDVLRTLDSSSLAGVVSPSLLGSSGYVPFSIVGTIPTIMTHYASLIANAQHEVIIATNYWEPSQAVTIVTNAFRALSARVIAEGADRPPVVIKLMYDRGTIKQAISPHVLVQPHEWEKVGIPKQEEIPGVELEVINYHQPVVGTFHAKYMVVDRKVACLNSNNIQDRVNLEMMVQVEGDIVESFYDMALLSWDVALTPTLPLLGKPPQPMGDGRGAFGKENGNLSYLYTERAGTKDFRPSESDLIPIPSSSAEEDGESKVGGEVYLDYLTSYLNGIVTHATASVQFSEDLLNFSPFIVHDPHTPVPIAMVNRHPRGTPGHAHALDCPQDVAWLSAIKNAQERVFIQSPTLNASPVIPAILDACRREVHVTIYLSLGYNDLGEMLPLQGGTNEQVASEMYKTLNGEQKSQFLHICWYVAKDQCIPISSTKKERSSHVKFMSVDGRVAIVGNGNQDTQSWWHSQEINIMVDCRKIVENWEKAINQNQNTWKYGMVDTADGVWRDTQGNAVQSSGTKTSGVVGLLKGGVAAVKRVRGTGGF